MASKNKRFIPLLSRDEKHARHAIHYKTKRILIPDQLIKKRLDKEQCGFDVPSILKILPGVLHKIESLTPPSKQLERNEAISQVSDTVSVIDQLHARMDFMDINVEIEVASYYRERSLDYDDVAIVIKSLSTQFREALNTAQANLEKHTSKTGPRKSPWLDARAELAECLYLWNSKGISKKNSIKIAADLLSLCGFSATRKPKRRQ